VNTTGTTTTSTATNPISIDCLMKFAVLEHEGRVLTRCGQTPSVTIIEVDQATQSVQQATHHGTVNSGSLPEWLRRQEVSLVLTGGFSKADTDACERNGIHVVVGIPAFRVEPVIAQFLAGTLETGVNVCKQEQEPGISSSQPKTSQTQTANHQTQSLTI
jgi:predicted Fe-Mo cluster-binding NifX family protein